MPGPSLPTQGLLSILTGALLEGLRVAGWVENQPLTPDFWDHHLLQHRRSNHVFK
jgi:hypothetical protein